ncbi:MAG: RND family transporter [Deltaproteobacteria bacterium]|nr:RND family transporter [Deltaproteobacteria bacterium]
MKFLALFVTSRPRLVIAATLLITAFFGWQLRTLTIDNEVKNFLPDEQEDKQNYMRMDELFKGEIVAFVGLSVEPGGPFRDVFDPKVLAIVQELTDWLKTVEIQDARERWAWVKAEEATPAPTGRERMTRVCTPEQLAALDAQPIPEDLDGYVKVWQCNEPGTWALDDVVSLATMKTIGDRALPPGLDGQTPHQLAIEDLWETVPTTTEEADAAREKIRSWSMYANNVVSPDLTSTMVVVFLPTGISIKYEEELQRILDAHIAEIDRTDDGIAFAAGGLPLVNVWIGRYLLGDLRLLIPFVLLVILVVLILSFRKAMGVVLPILNVLIATIWTVGFVALVGKPLSLITSSLPTLIIAVGSAYAIHVIHHYLETRRGGRSHEDSIRRTITHVGMAVVMAGLTTVGGFMSLTTTTVIPIRDFGFFAAFGTFASLFIALTFIPAVIRLMKRTNVEPEASAVSEVPSTATPTLFDRLLGRLSDMTLHHRGAVGAGIIVIVVAGVALANRIEVTSNVVKYFPSDSPIRMSDDFLNEHFGGTNVFSLVLDGGADDYWKNPENLRKLEALVAHVSETHPDVGSAISMIDYIKKMNMALEYDNPAEYRIPETQQAVADCLFLFSQKSDSLESLTDFEFRRARVAFKTRDGQTAAMFRLKTDVDHWIRDDWPEMYVTKERRLTPVQRVAEIFGFLPPSSFSVSERYYFSGMNNLRMIVDRMIVISQIRSLAFSLLAVWILATIIFRSFVGGLLSVLPTVIAVLINFATMALLGIPLDIGTSIASAVAIGCGIDYAIHFINRFLIEIRASKNAEVAVRRTHLTTAKAIIFNATAVAFGYFVLLASNFTPIKRLGLLTGVAMFTASFAALIVLPTLLVTIKPRFVRKAEFESEDADEISRPDAARVSK